MWMWQGILYFNIERMGVPDMKSIWKAVQINEGIVNFFQGSWPSYNKKEKKTYLLF